MREIGVLVSEIGCSDEGDWGLDEGDWGLGEPDWLFRCGRLGS